MEEQTKKLLDKTFMLMAILVVGVLVFFVGQIMLQSRAIDVQDQNQITVSGTGKVYAKPDVAIISLGVTTTAVTVADVTKTNTEKMNAVIEAIKALKIDEKDIQTTNYNLTPVYESYSVSSIEPMMYPIDGVARRTGSRLTGYKLEQNVQVKIRDFTIIGDVLSQGTGKGANLVGDLQFTIDDPEEFRKQARAKAIEQAKASAQNIAEESGIKLGKVINVYENSSPYPIAYDSMKNAGMGEAQILSAPTIQPGEQEINITVNLTYQVR